MNAPTIQQKATGLAALRTAQRAALKVTRGRTAVVSQLSQAERRRVRRALERKSARLTGVRPVGAVEPSLAAMRKSVSGLEASVIAESFAVIDVPDDELADALDDLAKPWSQWTPEAVEASRDALARLCAEPGEFVNDLTYDEEASK